MKSLNPTVRTAVIGLGKMGAHHARVYSSLEAALLVGVYDVDQHRARATAEELGCRAFVSMEDMWQSELDAVSIAVPTSLHASMAVAALEHGVHVLVEKPIASTRNEAESMIAAARRFERKLMVGHIERFNPAVQAIKRVVDPDEIISMHLMRVGPLPPRVKDAGVIIDLAVHDIDLVHYLYDARPDAVYCVRSSNISQLEDSASILLRMRGGASAQITSNWITPYKAREIQVITASRLIKANLITQQVQEFSRYTDEGYVVKDIFVRQQEPLRAELQSFLDCIVEARPPAVSGAEGLHALEVAIEATSYGQLETVAA